MIVHPLTENQRARRHDLVDRDDIDLLVRSFYRYATMDELLGPIFARAGVDWPSHIETLTDFWSWQLLGERGYDANPCAPTADVATTRGAKMIAALQRLLSGSSAAADEPLRPVWTTAPAP